MPQVGTEVTGSRLRLNLVTPVLCRPPQGCTPSAMNGAAYNGHLEVVRWLHENRSEVGKGDGGCRELACRPGSDVCVSARDGRTGPVLCVGRAGHLLVL